MTKWLSQGKEIRLDLSTRESFHSHPWVLQLIPPYQRKRRLAEYAVETIVSDLLALDREHYKNRGRGLFTSVKGRAKDEESFFHKLYRECSGEADKTGITQEELWTAFENIDDLAGVRYACPYFDEVEHSVSALVRPYLAPKGYAIHLGENTNLGDKNLLDEGDEYGYRAYHFYVRVPTVIDIWDNAELCLCEVQARSELQHAWAEKSHDLLYKQDVSAWDHNDPNLLEDMRQLSNNLRAADQFLVSIRDRIRRSR